MAWKKVLSRIRQRLFQKRSDFEPRFVAAGEPTVALMTPEEAQAFNKPGQHIAYIAPAESKEDVKYAVYLAKGMSMTGTANWMDGNENVIRLKSHRKLDSQVMKDFEVAVEESSEGKPVIVIITNTPQMPTFEIKHIVKVSDSDDETPPTAPAGNHVFLEAPYYDEQIIEALALASNRLLDQKHTGFIERKGEAEGYKKPYSDFHLMVCLFFYIHIHKLHADRTFYNTQRSQFHKFCTERLPKDFVTNTKRYFTGCISNLDTKGYGFEKYIREEEKPHLKAKTGVQDLTFWYSIYHKAAICFKEVLKPTK